MSGITLSDLNPLLAQFAGEGTVLSCYADLGVREAFRPVWEAPFKAGSDRLWKAIGEDGRARQELDENLSSVQRGLEAATADGARWAAVFAAARRNFLLIHPLDVPVETDLVLDRSPYLVPLLEAIARRREYLAVYTNTHRGRLYAATPGEVKLLQEIDGEVPRKQHSAGERWGYSQATIARHREECILHYHKELVHELEKAWDTGRHAGLMLLGEHVVLEHLRPVLPKRLAARIVREATEAGYEPTSKVEETIRTLAAELYAGEQIPSEFWDRLREGKAVATGPRAVIDAIQNGRIAPGGHGYLVFGPDPRETAGRCVACRSLSTEVLGPCPKCGAPCAPGNLWEELLLTALQHRIAAHFIQDPRRLAPQGGVVAMLAKDGRAAG
jgi:hypothetical protein